MPVLSPEERRKAEMKAYEKMLEKIKRANKEKLVLLEQVEESIEKMREMDRKAKPLIFVHHSSFESVMIALAKENYEVRKNDMIEPGTVVLVNRNSLYFPPLPES